MPLASLILLRKTTFWRQRWKRITDWSAGGRLQPRAKEWTPILPGVLGTAAAKAQQHSVITLLSHRGAMGAGMEHNHTQVTGAVTRARCTEGTWKCMDRHLSSLNMSMYTHAHTHRGGWAMWRMSALKQRITTFLVIFTCDYYNGSNNGIKLQFLLIRK